MAPLTDICSRGEYCSDQPIRGDYCGDQPIRGEYCGDQPIRGEYYSDQPMRADLQQGVDHPVPEVGVVVLLVVGSLVRDATHCHHIGRGPGLCRTRSGPFYISFDIAIPKRHSHFRSLPWSTDYME